MTTPAHKTGRAGHTPGPWERGGLTRDRYVTEGSPSEGIFELGDVNIFPPLGEAGPVAIAAGIGNADRIVRACNSHDALVWLVGEAAALQATNYGDATALHLAMIIWTNKARVTLAKAHSPPEPSS